MPGILTGSALGEGARRRDNGLRSSFVSHRAHVPMASILNYAPELRALTSGRGIFVMEFDHYDVVPEHLMSKIVEDSKKESGGEE